MVTAVNCPGGCSPGFASRLTLADSRRVFVKAVDAVAWPADGQLYRAEATVAALLPAGCGVPGDHPRLGGWRHLSCCSLATGWLWSTGRMPGAEPQAWTP